MTEDSSGRIWVVEKFFALLEEKQIFKAGQLEEIREKVMQNRVPLGKILLESELITMSELLDILEVKGAQPERRIGEIAMDRGLITPEQVSKALDHQMKTNPHPVEVILDEDLADRDLIMALLVEYIKLLESYIIKVSGNRPLNDPDLPVSTHEKAEGKG